MLAMRRVSATAATVPRKVHVHRQHLRVESQIEAAQAVKAAQQQSGADEQHHR